MASSSFSIYLFLVALFALGSYAIKSERDLRKDIFLNYDRLVRPVNEATNTITVKTRLYPLSLRSMSLKDQTLVLDTWILMQWTDDFLQWDPSEYDNITVLLLPASEIWKPDLALYTATPDTSLFPVINSQAVIYNTGKIVWEPPFTLKNRCSQFSPGNLIADRSVVECSIRFGSWTYDAKLMDIQLFSKEVDLKFFENSNFEWKLLKFVSGREPKTYPCCPDEVYPVLDFNVTLMRRNCLNSIMNS